MEKKSNHYVPQFYLKNFSNNKKSIGTYIWKLDKYIKQASIKKQACKDYLYGEDGILENNLMIQEKNWSKIISDVIKKEKIQINPELNIQSYVDLNVFILISEARNLRYADFVNKQVDFMCKKIMREDPNFKLDEDLDDFEIGVKIPNLMTIDASIKHSKTIFDLRRCLLINKTDRHFITSDNPTIKYNQFYLHRNYHCGYGLANVGLQIFFPISSKLCICLYDSQVYDVPVNKDGNIEIVRSKQIDEINKLIYLNSYKNVFFSDTVKENYIKKLAEEVKSFREKDYTEIGEFPSNIGEIIRISPRKVDYKMKLPIFRLKKEYINMELPNHMAGPVRSWVKMLESIDTDEYIR